MWAVVPSMAHAEVGVAELQARIDAIRNQAFAVEFQNTRQAIRHYLAEEIQNHLQTPERRTMWDNLQRCSVFLEDSLDQDSRIRNSIQLMSSSDEDREQTLHQMMIANESWSPPIEWAVNVLLRGGLNAETVRAFLAQKSLWPDSVWNSVLFLQKHASLHKQVLAYRLLGTRSSIPTVNLETAQKQLKEMLMRNPPPPEKIFAELKSIQLLRANKTLKPSDLSTDDRWLLRHLDAREVFLRAYLLTRK